LKIVKSPYLSETIIVVNCRSYVILIVVVWFFETQCIFLHSRELIYSIYYYALNTH